MPPTEQEEDSGKLVFCWPVLLTGDKFLTSDECFLRQTFTEIKPKSVGIFVLCLILPDWEIGNQRGTDAVNWKISQGCGSLASTGAMSLLFCCPPLSLLLSSAHSQPAQDPQSSLLCPRQGRVGTRLNWQLLPQQRQQDQLSFATATIPARGIKGDALEQRSLSWLNVCGDFPCLTFS